MGYSPRGMGYSPRGVGYTAKASFYITPTVIIELSKMTSFIAINFAFRSIIRAQKPVMPKPRFLITP